MYKMSFIGTGNMAGALVAAAAAGGYGADCLLTNRTPEKARALAAQHGCAVAETNAEAARNGRFVFLGVKPQMMAGMLAGIAPVLADRQAAVLERVRFYKNLRSHLEAISYQIEKRATVFAAAVHSVGVRLEVFPYLAEDIEEEARVQAGAAHTFGVRVDIYPHVYRKMNTEWRVQCAGYIQQTGKLEIFPQNRTEA